MFCIGCSLEVKILSGGQLSVMMALKLEMVTRFHNHHIGAISNPRATNADVGDYAFPCNSIFQ